MKYLRFKATDILKFKEFLEKLEDERESYITDDDFVIRKSFRLITVRIKDDNISTSLIDSIISFVKVHSV